MNNYITTNCALLLMLSILFIIILYIYIYPNFPRNTVVRLFTIPPSEWKPLGQDVSAASAEKEINKI